MSLIDQVKSTCLASVDHSGIQIDEDGARTFLRNLDEADFQKWSADHGYRFPLKYQDDLDELNFLSILTILNFLSAYRIPLHRMTGAGAYDTIRRFVMSCYLSQTGPAPLTARGMATMSEHQASEYLKVPILTERDHPTLPVKIGERDPAAVEIVGLVLGVMNETGKILQRDGAKDLGDWVARTLHEKKSASPEERRDHLLEKLVTTFPAFADEGKVKGHTVKVYKKAQLLVHIIGEAFESRATTVPFPLPAITGITACVDNVVPTMAVHFKLLDLSSCVYSVYASGLGEAASSGEKVEGISQSHEEAYAIRAATVAACERTIQLCPEIANETGKDWLREITAMDLDGYLWMKAKDGNLRNLPRLSERGTVFY